MDSQVTTGFVLSLYNYKVSLLSAPFTRLPNFNFRLPLPNLAKMAQ